jgi:hypothetical protein
MLSSQPTCPRSWSSSSRIFRCTPHANCTHPRRPFRHIAKKRIEKELIGGTQLGCGDQEIRGRRGSTGWWIVSGVLSAGSGHVGRRSDAVRSVSLCERGDAMI